MAVLIGPRIRFPERGRTRGGHAISGFNLDTPPPLLLFLIYYLTMATYNGIPAVQTLLNCHADGHRVVQNTEPPTEPESSFARAARIRNFLESRSPTPYISRFRIQADRYLVHRRVIRNFHFRMSLFHFS